MNRSRAFVLALTTLTLIAAVIQFRERDEAAPLTDAGWLIGDCVDYRDMAKSLIVNGSVDYDLVNPREASRYDGTGRFNRSATRSNVSLAADGGLVPKHSVLFAAALVLPYAALQEWGLLFFNWAQCVVIVLLVYGLLLRYFVPDIAFLGALVFLFDGVIPNYTYNVSPDIFGAVLVLGGTLLMWQAGTSRWRALIGGAALGLAVWLRPLNLIGLVAFLPFAATSWRGRRLDGRLVSALWGFSAALGGYLLLNMSWFGSPLITPYDRILVLTDGVRSIASHRSDMNRPFWASLLPTLVTAPHGFLETAPHWPLVLPPLFFLARRRLAEALAITSLIFGPALVMVKYNYWEMSHFGNRFLILSAAVSALGIGWLAQALRARRADCLALTPVDPVLWPDSESEEPSSGVIGVGGRPPDGEAGPVSVGDRPRIVIILSALIPLGLLGWNTVTRTTGLDFRGLSGDWTRAWDDVAIAAGFVEHGAFPVAPYLVTNGFSRKGQVAFDDFKNTFGALEVAHQTRLSRPFEGFDATDLFPRRPRVAQRFDDVGRAYLVGLGFRAVGKVAPGTLFWLGPLVAAVVLLWIVVEAVRAGWAIFGLGVSGLVAVSAYCIDTLTLGYSAAGFYIISILVCLAYGIGLLGARQGVAGLVARSAVAGIVLGLCFNARSMAITVLPAILITLAVGARRITTRRSRRSVAIAGSVVCLLAPWLLLRAHIGNLSEQAADRFGGDPAPGSHDIWITYWQGLGDFDRTHGHTFLDQAGLETLRANGGRERVSPKSEAIMRRVVLASIRSEPLWFGGILIKRAVATMSFRKLWPMASSTTPGFEPSATPNEGATDSYWSMTGQADQFRLGRAELEVPAWLFPLALTILIWMCLRAAPSETMALRHRIISVVGLVALAALPGPVATTTAGSFEPQAFVVVIFAAFATFIQLGVATFRTRQRPNA